MVKKSLLVFLLIAVLGMGLVAAQDSDLANVDPSGQTIVYWNQYTNDLQKAAMNALIEEFNANNEWGIAVENPVNAGYSDLEDQMGTAITSGELPNLVAGYANAAADWAADGAVVDLEPYYNDPTWGFTDEEKADFNQQFLDVDVAEDGMRLAWPNQSSARVMVVNTSMLNELGIDKVPETFEEFKEAACAASQMTGPNGEDIQGFAMSIDASEFESLLAGMGGTFYHDGAYDFTNDEVVATFQLYKDLYDQDCSYIATDADRRFGNTDDFALGLNAMATTSTAGLPIIRGAFETAGNESEWVVTTTPWTEGNRTIQLFVPSLIAITSTPEKQLASWLFIKYLASPENQARWTTETLYFTPGISAQEMLGEKAINDQFFNAAASLVNDPDIGIYASPAIASYTAVRRLIQDAVIAVTSGGQSVEEVTAQLEADANALLEE
jgi:multiple sugar transport system substrate-binding protein